MRTRTFSEEEKIQIKERMLEAGMPLLKEYGITHMSITKLTKAVGIGKSTFYSFYSSKEEFVNEMLRYNRMKFLTSFEQKLMGRAKLTREESKVFFKELFLHMNEIYGSLSAEDERKLFDADCNNNINPVDLNREIPIMQKLFSYLEGVRENPDYAAISNLMKLIVMGMEQKYLLHESGYEEMQEQLINTMLNMIFDTPND